MSVSEIRPPAARFDVVDWADASARSTLQLIASSVAQMVGFEVAVISAVQGDVLVSVAIEGGEDVQVVLTTMRTPVAHVHAEIEAADDWGHFKFVPHDRAPDDDTFRWIPEIEQSLEPDAWHPLDALLAPLYSASGELCGLLSIDVPLSGRRPDATQMQLLERYATQAERALQNAFERDALERRLRLAEATRQVVRFAVSQPDVETALDEVGPALLEGFRADDLILRTYRAEGIEPGGSPSMEASREVRSAVFTLANTCWEQHRVGILTSSFHDEDLLTPAQGSLLRSYAANLGYSSGMLVPIGAGSICLGHLILFRKDDETPWTADEQAGSLDVARDIGHAVMGARNLIREQTLVEELRGLDTYKSQLLSTVSHELKNPLAAITGHLEILSSHDDLGAEISFSVGAMERASSRLVRVVDDLLTLAEVADPNLEEQGELVPIDLRPLVEATVELALLPATRRRVRFEISAPDGPLLVRAHEHELERVLSNLVSNAVKYSPGGGRVAVSVARSPDELVISVSDDGIGISPEDQERLFAEFFRSTNPQALALPGTGLGLAISSRIVSRYGGRIEVDSAIGSGSTFRVALPAAS